MGFLIYEDEYCTVDGRPSNLQMMADVKMHVFYSTNVKDIIDKSRNDGLFIELIKEMEQREHLQALFTDAKIAYEKNLKGFYLFYIVGKNTIEWNETEEFSSEQIQNTVLDSSNGVIIRYFNINTYLCFNDFWDDIFKCINTTLKQQKVKIYL